LDCIPFFEIYHEVVGHVVRRRERRGL